MAAEGLHGVVIIVYVDDVLLAAPSFEILQRVHTIMDELATRLGVEFKSSKDEGLDTPTYSLEFLGHWLTTEGVVQA